ncbi:MAG TPA: hypothetical protein VFA19_05210 [Gaiellaceae bacterium]|nr:hypothetical protein [Gaiellaceae bacterium]
MSAVPVFVNCRDRVAALAQLVSWLEGAGSEEIYLLDNDSSYEPLLEYYEKTPHEVVRLGRNWGRFALWLAPGVFERTRGRGFVYTDPDIVPSEECPHDALDRFDELLRRYPGVNKVGFGLRIDDIPDHYAHKEAVILWERQHWRWRVERGAYFSAIDTTFALHRPNGQPRPADAIRTGPPYVARHMPWYADLDRPSAEERFYRTRGGEQHHWNTDGLPEWLDEALAGLRAEHRSLPAEAVLRLRMFVRLHWTLRGRRLLPARPAP